MCSLHGSRKTVASSVHDAHRTWTGQAEQSLVSFSLTPAANDPDADRLAVAEADPSAPGGYRPFTGEAVCAPPS